jgi:endonuclease/exonuclease/phosphatase (EEP) superfamily protein YafD
MVMEVVGIYGPVDHGRSRAFLDELSLKIASSSRPLLVGGDFNLIRSAADKNNGNLNWPLIDLFNEHIAMWDLQEIPRTGARFTWTNRQLNPVRSALDRVFISQSFETMFPLCSLAVETSLGSDHTPLLFDSGDELPKRPARFFFETSWFERQDFFFLKR